jgi:hypothetical protein
MKNVTSTPANDVAVKSTKAKASSTTATATTTAPAEKKTNPSKSAAYTRYKQRQALIKEGKEVPAELQKRPSGNAIGRRTKDESNLSVAELAKLERLREIKKVASRECVARNKAIKAIGFCPAEHLPRKFKEEKFDIGQYRTANKVDGIGTTKLSLARVAPTEDKPNVSYQLVKEFNPSSKNKEAQKAKDKIDIKGGLREAVMKFEKELKAIKK